MFSVCLSVCMYVCMFVMDSKTAEPIKMKLSQNLNMNFRQVIGYRAFLCDVWGPRYKPRKGPQRCEVNFFRIKKIFFTEEIFRFFTLEKI